MLYALDKSRPSKCKFSDFWLLAQKLTKLLMSLFKPRVSFPLNFASPFNVMAYSSSWKIIWFGQKEPIEVPCFRLLSALIKVHPIPHAIFDTKSSEFIQILHHCSVSWKTTPLYFYSSNLAYFEQRDLIEMTFSDFWVVGWKFTKFLVSYLKPQVSFSLNFTLLFSVMRYKSSILF